MPASLQRSAMELDRRTDCASISGSLWAKAQVQFGDA